MVQHSGPLCIRSGFSLRDMAKVWILGTANQTPFNALKLLELTRFALEQSSLYSIMYLH